MSADEASPECKQRACRLCPGPRVIRRDGAPEWEAPIQTLRCGCLCHGRRTGRPPTQTAPIPQSPPSDRVRE